jgi:hypothetical protein
MAGESAGGGAGGNPFGGASGFFQGFGMSTDAWGTYFSARAAKKAYQLKAQLARENAAYLEGLARDSVRRGVTAESRQRGRIGQLKATQRARLAANGVVIDQGSALGVLQDTDLLGNIDALTIRENAAREAEGLIRERNNTLFEAAGYQAAAGSRSPFLEGLTSLLTQGKQVAHDYEQYNLSSQN